MSRCSRSSLVIISMACGESSGWDSMRVMPRSLDPRPIIIGASCGWPPALCRVTLPSGIRPLRMLSRGRRSLWAYPVQWRPIHARIGAASCGPAAWPGLWRRCRSVVGFPWAAAGVAHESLTGRRSERTGCRGGSGTTASCGGGAGVACLTEVGSLGWITSAQPSPQKKKPLKINGLKNVVETRRIELLTSALRTQRSPS